MNDNNTSPLIVGEVADIEQVMKFVSCSSGLPYIVPKFSANPFLLDERLAVKNSGSWYKSNNWRKMHGYPLRRKGRGRRVKYKSPKELSNFNIDDLFHQTVPSCRAPIIHCNEIPERALRIAELFEGVVDPLQLSGTRE